MFESIIESIVIEKCIKTTIHGRDVLILTINDAEKNRLYKSPYNCLSCRNSDRRIKLLWDMERPITEVRKATWTRLEWEGCKHYKTIFLDYHMRIKIEFLLREGGYLDV